MNILVIHGPNLNLLGTRSPEVYGKDTLDDINSALREEASAHKIIITFFQSNHEGAIIDTLHQARGKVDGIIINAGAFTHYSYAIRDAIESVQIPTVEVHLSNIYARESFRRHSVISEVCKGTIAGFGKISYLLALESFVIK